MTFDTTQHSLDLSRIINNLPTTVTISGTDYSCYKTIMSNERVYTNYGFGDDYDFTILLNQGDVGATTNLTLVTIASIEYRILQQEAGAGDKILRLHLGAKYGS